MTRLDRHVNLVRTKLFLGTWLASLAWALFFYAVLVLVVMAFDKTKALRPPHWEVWLLAGLGVALVAGTVMAWLRRPSARQAAVVIDQQLGLHEKFSTALYIRNASTDPFAAAAVRDAEATADRVSLQRRFNVHWPRQGLVTLAVAIVVVVVGVFVPRGMWVNANEQAQTPEQNKMVTAEKQKASDLLQSAIKEIDALPPEMARNPEVQAARANLAREIASPSKNAQQQQQTALKTMQDLDALKQKIADSQRLTNKDNHTSPSKDMSSSPLAADSDLKAAEEAMNKGNLTDAAAAVDKALNKFNEMKKEDQKKMADDMQQLSKNQQQQANQQQKKQEDVKDQLEKMGADKKQLDQLQKQLQAAAKGDQQAADQAKQLAEQVANQIANSPNATPQQQAAAKQALNQMQNAANNQAAAQKMAQAAQNLGQAMQQQAAGAQQQQGNAGQQGQANAQQPGKPQQGAGNQQGNQPQQGNQGAGGQQQAGGNQGNQQQQAGAGQGAGQPQPAGGNQPGQQAGGQPGGGQQPGKGNQPGGNQPGGVADQLQQFKQDARDAQQMADGGGNGAAPDGVPNAPQAGNGQGNGPPGGQPGDIGEGGNQWSPNQQQAAGGRRPKGQASLFGMKADKSPTQTNDGGELIASQFIKAPNVKGQSTAQLRDVIKSVENDPSDPVDQDRVSKQEEQIVKKYYDGISGGSPINNNKK